MGNLILTSGGYLDGQRSEKCDSVIENVCSNKKVLVVNNATLTGSNLNGLSVILNNFKNITPNVTQISLNNNNLSTINNFDVIYITGGDLAPLIKLVESSSLKKAIISYLKNGGCVIGESAGSMIFGKDLKWIYNIKRGTKPKYDVNLVTYKGLGLVDINFYPHWNKATDDIKERVSSYEISNNITITRVKDGDYLEFNV